MYRSSICSHCHREPAGDICVGCGLWTCAGCLANRCQTDHTAWTGHCRECGQLYPDDQRRDVLDDGDGEICCPRCGWTRRLRRLDRVADPQVASLHQAARCTRCARTHTPANLVLHVPAGDQLLYHLLCECGLTLASASSRIA